MIKGLILDYNRTLYNPETSKLMEGSMVILNYCKKKNIKISLMSRGESTRAQEIKDLGIENHFAKILIISKEKNELKNTSHFQECADAMNLSASEIVVVGDRIKAEIKYANSLGMITIWYKSGKYAKESPECNEEYPDYEVLSLNDVIPFLK